MRTKVSKENALKQAVEEFQFIIAYWNVVRPQYRKEFKLNGVFNFCEVEKGFAIVNNWKNKWKNATPHEYAEYKKYSAAINFTFGLKSESLKSILHWYSDENGNKGQLTLAEIIEATSREFAPIKVINNGKINSKKNGKFQTIASWSSKYLIDDKVIWKSLFKPGSNNIENIIINGKGASKKIIKLIKKICYKNNSVGFNNKVNVVKNTNTKKLNTTKSTTQVQNTTPAQNTIPAPVVQQNTPATNTTPKFYPLVYALNIGAITVDEAIELYKNIHNVVPNAIVIEKMNEKYFTNKSLQNTSKKIRIYEVLQQMIQHFGSSTARQTSIYRFLFELAK